ncbi:MAG: adenine methylase [Solirubrobacterales bacterium]|jgi:DNA adenine methylase|nr:adenine methylase [Solirubrobacterales bacterium]
MYEPFAGSAALTIAATEKEVARRYVIADSLNPLMEIWSAILARPEELARAYEKLWVEQEHEPRTHFNRVRSEYNDRGEAARLLYLLARCVKNAPRWNKSGGFSQSADHRRKGMRPTRMRDQIERCHRLLADKATGLIGDVFTTTAAAGKADLVYLDPPWEGTTCGPDTRYHEGFDRGALEILLDSLNDRRVAWILSYDGRHGSKVYGRPLDPALYGQHLELAAGRSSQATLSGRSDMTVESLYLSTSLVEQVANETAALRVAGPLQELLHNVA